MAEDINTEVALLKKEVTDIKFIFSRLDTAIERMVDVSSSVNRMLAVHEEKISQQEEASIRADTEFKADIKELHSRITTNTKEMMQAITSQHLEQQQTLDRMRVELNNRVGILEKWRWIIIGGSIIIGFIAQKFMIIGS